MQYAFLLKSYLSESQVLKSGLVTNATPVKKIDSVGLFFVCVFFLKCKYIEFFSCCSIQKSISVNAYFCNCPLISGNTVVAEHFPGLFIQSYLKSYVVFLFK